ncbi:MAG: phosphate ABC transporter permease PstA [Bdellovibrionota bacterium]
MRRRFSDTAFRGYGRRKLVNFVMCCLLSLAALGAIIPLFSVFGYVLSQGMPALNLSFFTELPKPVGESGGGMAHSLLGTCVLVFLGSIFGIPWGIATGMYLSEYGRGRLGGAVRFSADLLGSIPSIILGLFVYTLVVVTMKRFSAVAGGLALGLIMVPTVARSTEELLKLVPSHIREAGLALGLPRWKVSLRIVLKGIRGPITTGLMLAIARAAGETAPLLFTAFNNRFWSFELDQPISSLPVQIYTFAISPYEEWHRQAWAGAFLLVSVVFSLNLFTRVVFRQLRKD